jgi:D-alanyl-D-alanine dipeptidase
MANSRFGRPEGRIVPDVPRPPQAPSDPVSTVRTHNEGAGIVVNARTATPDWQGERLDVGYAIDVLHPLATRITA